jgi:hypothetical protein
MGGGGRGPAISGGGPAIGGVGSVGGGRGPVVGGGGRIGPVYGSHVPSVGGPVGGQWAGGNWNRGGNWHHHRRGGFWPGYGIGFGVGSYAYYGNPYYYDDYYYDDSVAVVPGYGGDAVAYCRQRFRSYDPASGTYLGYDGLRHPCP